MRLSSIVAFASFVATLALAAPVPSTSHTTIGTNGDALASENESSLSSKAGEAPSSAAVHSDSIHHLVRRNGNEHLHQDIQHHQGQLDTLEAAHPGLLDTYREKDREAARAYRAHEKAAKDGTLTQAHRDNRQNTADEKRRAQGHLRENEHMQTYHSNMIQGHKETIKANDKSDQMADPHADGPKLGREIQQHSANANAAYARATVAHRNAQHSRGNQ
ncbi:hypothetical protein FRC17_001446 [Serendipita sp. 399]|nr:hypothetical protein FRC17_001446 [Serendipita sp. 399]